MNERIKRIWDKILAHKKLAIIYLLLIFLSFAIYGHNLRNRFFVTAVFQDLRPFNKKITVYYNGFVIGHVVKVGPDNDYKATLVTMALYPLTLKIPENSRVVLKREKKKRKEYDYIELEYPASPSVKILKNGSVIEGKTSVDLENFMSNQDPDKLKSIENNINGTLESLQTTVEALGELFVIAQDIAEENRPYLKEASENLALTSINVRMAAEKLNGSIMPQNLSNTFVNVDTTSSNFVGTTKNLQDMSDNLNSITKNIDETMPKFDCIITNLAVTSANIADITGGVACTMRKRFGGMRVFFGKNDPCCKKGCNK